MCLWYLQIILTYFYDTTLKLLVDLKGIKVMSILGFVNKLWNSRLGSFYTGLRIFTICSKTVEGQCVLTIPTSIAGSWFTGGQ